MVRAHSWSGKQLTSHIPAAGATAGPTRIQIKLREFSNIIKHFDSPRAICEFSSRLKLRELQFYVAFYKCARFFLLLSEEHRLRVFDNKVLRVIFYLSREDVRDGWRKLHNENIRDFNYSPVILRLSNLSGWDWWACRTYGVKGKSIQDFGWEPWTKIH